MLKITALMMNLTAPTLLEWTVQKIPTKIPAQPKIEKLSIVMRNMIPTKIQTTEIHMIMMTMMTITKMMPMRTLPQKKKIKTFLRIMPPTILSQYCKKLLHWSKKVDHNHKTTETPMASQLT